MKRNVFFIMLMLLVWSAASVNAQVGIGSINNPHKGAVLDLSQSESDLGVLFPKVYIFDTKDFTLPVDGVVNAVGMVVYNNNVSLPDGAGLYAWNGSEWKSMSGSANSCVPVTAEVATGKTGTNAKITVTVTAGSPTFSYIWSKDGTPVRTTTNVSATSDTYTTTSEDTYTVTVTNPCTATPISFTFTVDDEGGILTANRNGTFTNEKGQLVYDGKEYNPVESDVPGIYIDDLTKEIVYVGADGIPGNEDDNVFVQPNYPLPTQKTLFSVKYPYTRVNNDKEYDIVLDFAEDSYSGKIKYISNDTSMIQVLNASTGKIKVVTSKHDVASIVTIILEDGSICNTQFAIARISEKANMLKANDVTLGVGFIKSVAVVNAITPTGSIVVGNVSTINYEIIEKGGTGSEITSGGWFHANGVGTVRVKATAVVLDSDTPPEPIEFNVIILGTPSAEDNPTNISPGWATLEPAPAYGGGDGTEANPYQISSIRQFKKLAVDIQLLGSVEATYQKYFDLTVDLDFSADKTVKQTLIGPFMGTLDGKGHLIKNLDMDVSGKFGVSVFGSLGYGEIKNLGREKGHITGVDGSNVAGLVYEINSGGKLRNCYNSSDITVFRIASGLVCLLTTDAVVENCYNTGNVTTSGGTTGTQAAGLVLAENIGGTATIINSYNAGNIKGLDRVGGIVGLLNTPNLKKLIFNMSNCFNFGEVTITNNNDIVGSIIGATVYEAAGIGYESADPLYEVNATNVYSRPGVASANNGNVPKPNQPIGWMDPNGMNQKDDILAANPTLGENEKYTIEYSKSADFVPELGGAFKYAPGRTPKLAWEK